MDARSAAVVLSAIVIAAVGCAVNETIVARVADRDIAVDEVQSYIVSATGMPWQSVDRRAAEALFDQFIDQEVMLHRVADGPVGVAESDPAQRSATVRSLVSRICGEPPVPSEEDVERELAAATGLIRPARARVRQMLVVGLEEALSVRARLAEGQSFVDVSAEISKAANAQQGGDLGWIARGTLPEDLDAVVFSLGEGEISEPVASPSGYHVFQVLEAEPEGPASRAEVEPAVRRRLADDLLRAFTAQCVARTAATVGVMVFDDHLWFEYRGRYGEAVHEG